MLILKKYTVFNVFLAFFLYKMPFIMMCGFPASGKTTRCHDLEKYFSLKRGRVVKVVNDDLLELDKNLAYSCE